MASDDNTLRALISQAKRKCTGEFIHLIDSVTGRLSVILDGRSPWKKELVEYQKEQYEKILVAFLAGVPYKELRPRFYNRKLNPDFCGCSKDEEEARKKMAEREKGNDNED